eukprot:2726880-Alexandrium_andersonii.AAC.1
MLLWWWCAVRDGRLPVCRVRQPQFAVVLLVGPRRLGRLRCGVQWGAGFQCRHGRGAGVRWGGH